MMSVFVVEDGPIHLDERGEGRFAACEDGFSLLALCRSHEREAGLDERQLEARTR